MTIPLLMPLHERIALVPRLNALAQSLAAKRSLAVEEARKRVADAIESGGLTIGAAARRGSQFVESLRAVHDILQPSSDRAPWKMAYEDFQRAGFAIRRGEIEPTGAYFSTPGESTYHDSESEDATVARYDLSGLMIADTEIPEVALAIVRESLIEPGHSDADRARLLELIAEIEEGDYSISYMECDELVLSYAAQRLGWDGIRVWESDDIGRPSSVFVWSVDRIDRVASNHRQAVLDAIEQGLPVQEWVRREAVQRDESTAHATLDKQAVQAVSKRLGLPVEAVASVVADGVATLQGRDRFLAPNNMMEPQDFPRYPYGTAKIQHWNADPKEAYVDFLDCFLASALGTSEPEDQIRKHPTLARYVEMLQQGYEAPYIHVFETNGKLTASNRRRTLAAQEVDGLICGWHGIDNPETGLPVKYGDVLRAYEAELVQVNAARVLPVTRPEKVDANEHTGMDAGPG